MRAAKQPDAGFTLLELLISITILSLILVALTGGVHFAGRAWRSQEDRNARQGDVSAVQSVLRQMLASGRNFDGDSRRLKFVGKLPAALARGGLFDIELQSDDEGLSLSWRPHFKGPADALKQNEVRILDGIMTTSFAYFFESGGWQGSTAGQTKSLQLIAVQVRLANGRDWPPLVLTPMLAVPAKPKT